MSETLLDATPVLGTRATPSVPVRAIVATIIGNWLEFYDFTVYSIFAVMIGRQFFPPQSESGSLLLSVATFGIGFITRPLGGIVIGAYADRRGRKPAMTLTILLMAIGTGLIGVTPSYATIGLAAPVILVIARLLQGFSSGGELGPATTYLMEAAPVGRRAALTAWQNISQLLAVIAGSLVGFVLSLILPSDDLYAWGWRVPFLLGIVIAPVGFYIRRQLPETLPLAEARRTSAEVLKNLLGNHTRPLILGILAICGATVSTYVATYFTSYALTTLHLTPRDAMFVTLASSAAGLLGLPVGAWLSDRFGRKRPIIAMRLVYMAAVYPVYFLLTRPEATVTTLVLAEGSLRLLGGVSGGGLLALLCEAFPRTTRSSGMSIVYAISVTLFGGSAQFIVAWLIDATGNPLVPAWYVMATSLVTICAVALIKPDRGERGLDVFDAKH